MPEGTINSSTLANGIPVNESTFLAYKVDKKWLKPGENILAAEVHQISASSSDVEFRCKTHPDVQ